MIILYDCWYLASVMMPDVYATYKKRDDICDDVCGQVCLYLLFYFTVLRFCIYIFFNVKVCFLKIFFLGFIFYEICDGGYCLMN